MLGVTSLCVGMSSSFGNKTPGGIWSSSSTTIAKVSNTGMVTALSAGKAIISYTVSNNCGKVVSVLPVTILPANECRAMYEEEVNSNIRRLDVYPNPSNGSFTLLLSGTAADQVTVVITNVTGQQVKKLDIQENTATKINLEGFPSGIYFVLASTRQGSYTAKLIIQ